MRQISNKCETLVSNLTKKLDPIHKLVVMDYPGTIEGIYAFRHGFSESICLLNPSFKNSNFSMASMKDFSRFPDYEISRWNDSTTIRFKEIK